MRTGLFYLHTSSAPEFLVFSILSQNQNPRTILRKRAAMPYDLLHSCTVIAQQMCVMHHICSRLYHPGARDIFNFIFYFYHPLYRSLTFGLLRKTKKRPVEAYSRISRTRFRCTHPDQTFPQIKYELVCPTRAGLFYLLSSSALAFLVFLYSSSTGSLYQTQNPRTIRHAPQNKDRATHDTLRILATVARRVPCITSVPRYTPQLVARASST